MRAVIFDIDGTVADPRHRLHHLQGEYKDWDSFHDAMVDDPPIASVVWLVQKLAAVMTNPEDPFAILFVTARHTPYQERTETQLANFGCVYTRLYMRDNEDRRQDHLVKADILDQILQDGYEIMFVVDDRPEVVKMWRSYGLVCLQCAPDDPPLSRFAGQTLLDLLVGPAGAGKSSYCEKHYKAGEVISSDAVRIQLFGSIEGGQGEDEQRLVWRYIKGMIKLRMELGIFTVLDATNLRVKDRLSALECMQPGQIARYILIDRDYDEKIRDRGWRPVELIDKHHRQFQSALGLLKNVDDQPNVILHDARNKR